VLSGLPINFHNPVLGTIAEAQPEALSPGAQAIATFNAGSTGGQGSAALRWTSKRSRHIGGALAPRAGPH